MARTYLDINPEVLQWARERARFAEEDLAKKARVKLATYRHWETGDAKPTLRQLYKLVQALNRPLQMFFMSQIPDEPETLAEMRRLPGVPVGRESPDLAIQVQLALERRGIALRLYDDLGESPPDLTIRVDQDQDPENLAKSLRQILGVSSEEQASWGNPHQAIRAWRSALEHHGVLLFQIPRVSLQEMRGFSLSLRPLPIIGVNSKEYPRPRTFTIFHEFVHVLLGEKVLHASHPGWFQIDPSITVEHFCNNVAAGILVPESDLASQLRIRTKRKDDDWHDHEVASLSSRYQVSRAVIIRRLRRLGFISYNSYESLRRQYDDFVPPPRSGQGGGNFYSNKIAQLGTLIPELAFRSYYANKLSTSDLSSLFGLKVSKLGRLEERILGFSYGFGRA